MGTPDPSQPRAVETPLPIVQADAPPSDIEIGVTTSDDSDSGWEPTPVTHAAFAYVVLSAIYGTLRYVVCLTGIHRRRGWKS